MYIEDALTGVSGPQIPYPLAAYITQQACCGLHPYEIKAFSDAYLILGFYLKEHKLLNDNMYCIVVYTDKEKISLLHAGKELGQAVPIVVLWMKEIRQANPSNNQFFLLKILLEELCHSLFRIYNEYLVKYKVFDIVHLADSSKTLHNLYPLVFDENDKPIPSAYPEFYDEITKLTPP